MKKLITIILLLSLCLLCSCSPKNENKTDTTPTTEPTTEATPTYTYFEDAGGIIPKPDSVNSAITYKTDTEDNDGSIIHVYTYSYSSTDDVVKIRTAYIDAVEKNAELSVSKSYSVDSATGIWTVKKDGTGICWIISSPGTLSIKFLTEENTTN